jgi:hypothetical protein
MTKLINRYIFYLAYLILKNNMKPHPFYFIFILIGIALCGCAQTATDNKPGPVVVSSPPQNSVTTTAIPILTTTSANQSDPIVGTWVCRSYLTSGPLKKEYTFLENNTWTRTNTNLESLVQGYAKGTWGKDSETNYWIKVSAAGEPHPFEYDKNKDSLYEPGFKETFYRVPEEKILDKKIPTMSITGNFARKVSKIPPGARPQSGFDYLLIDVTIKNINKQDGFSFDDKNIRVIYDDGPGAYAQNKKLKDRINNSISSGIIGIGEKREGIAIFAIPENSDSCSLKVVDNEGDLVSNIVELNNIQTTEM